MRLPGVVLSPHLQVRGAATLSRYFKAAADATDAEGWFDTGEGRLASPPATSAPLDRRHPLTAPRHAAPAAAPSALPCSGDVATIDARGHMQITDRSKDVIKARRGLLHALEGCR